MRLTIYGDFNCPYSALASGRTDLLLEAAHHEIDWRAIQHDPAIPTGGEPTDGALAAELAREVAEISELSNYDLRLDLRVPTVRANTEEACAAFAAGADDPHPLRRRLFAAVWTEGDNVGDPLVLDRVAGHSRDHARAGHWQQQYGSLPRPITPSLVFPDGRVSRGLGALAQLAALGR
jgi:predicted DsbA family dithiol-disulfide isomerase